MFKQTALHFFQVLKRLFTWHYCRQMLASHMESLSETRRCRSGDPPVSTTDDKPNHPCFYTADGFMINIVLIFLILLILVVKNIVMQPSNNLNISRYMYVTGIKCHLHVKLVACNQLA